MSEMDVQRMGSEEIAKARTEISSFPVAKVRRMHESADRILKKCYKQTKFDLSSVDAIAGSREEKMNKIDELQALVAATTDHLSQLGLVDSLKSRLETRMAQGDGSLNSADIDKIVDRIMQSNYSGKQAGDSLFGHVLEDEGFRNFMDNTKGGSLTGGRHTVTLSGQDVLNTVMTTGSNGVSAQSIRSGRMVDPVFGSWEIADLMPMITTDQQSYAWLEMASSTELTEKEEGASGVDLASSGTERQATLRRISGYQQVTEDQLAYVPGLEEFLNRVLPLKLRIRLAKQLAAGAAASPNIYGFFPRGNGSPNAVQIQETADTGGTTPLLDDIIDADQRIVHSMGIMADGVVFHPTTWGNIRKSKGDGLYLYGSPADAQAQRVFGKRIAQNSFTPINTTPNPDETECLVGNFTLGAALIAQNTIQVTQGMINDDFVKHQLAFRVSGKFQLALFYTRAFEIITGIPIA